MQVTIGPLDPNCSCAYAQKCSHIPAILNALYIYLKITFHLWQMTFHLWQIDYSYVGVRTNARFVIMPKWDECASVNLDASVVDRNDNYGHVSRVSQSAHPHVDCQMQRHFGQRTLFNSWSDSMRLMRSFVDVCLNSRSRSISTSSTVFTSRMYCALVLVACRH